MKTATIIYWDNGEYRAVCEQEIVASGDSREECEQAAKDNGYETR